MFKTLVPFVLLAGVLSQKVVTASSALDTLPKAVHTSPVVSIADATSTTPGRGSSARLKSQRLVSTFTAAKPQESSSKKTKLIPAAHFLRELVTNLPPESRSGVQRSDINSRDDFGSNLSCDACKVIVGQIQKMVDNQKTTEEIVKETIRVCQLYKIEDDRVCEYVVPQYQEMALSVIQGTILDPTEICGILLGNSCAVPFNPLEMWNITISDTPKPPVKPPATPKPESPVLRVLHLTDIHLDAEYTKGADAECGEPLCCRSSDIYPAPTSSRKAGVWGDYRHCDLPWRTLENLFCHLSDIRHKFDYVMFTGDIPAHDVWNQTQAAQLTSLLRVAELFRKYLPDKPVYTSMGNHESVPCNSFPPDTVEGQSMQWLYSAVLQAWGHWLPASTYGTILRGGFYSFSPFPGFRIISFNSNYGASLNWWLLLNSTDPLGQMQWLADVLQEAEDKGEKVHILSHFPPSELLKAFSWNYYQLVNRYESTITGQFHGHTHRDEYEVFYDLHNKSRPVGVSYIGGSVTPYSKLNPAYRIYTVDGNYPNSSWAILDFKHFYLNLSRVNLGDVLDWKEEYTAKESYQMDGLYPDDWNYLINRMTTNDTLFQMYLRFFYKSADHDECTDDCKLGMLCRLKTARPDDPTLCQDLRL